MPLAHFSALASSATTARLRPGSGSAVCVPPGNGGDQLMCESSLGLAGSLMSWMREPAVAPRRIAAIAGGDHVMQRHPAARGQRRLLAGRPIHAGQPPARHDLRLGDVVQIDDAEDVIGEAVEMRGNVRVAPARPPQPVDAEAGHFEEGDLLHLRRARDVVNAQARAELLAIGDAVGQVVLEIAAHVVVGLHRHDVRAVGEQHQIVGDLQVMRAGAAAGGEEADRLQPARIRGVENRHAVAEHVADVDMAAVDHDLHAVGPAALIAVGQVADAAPDALRRNRRLWRLSPLVRQARAPARAGPSAARQTSRPFMCSRRVMVSDYTAKRGVGWSKSRSRS